MKRFKRVCLLMILCASFSFALGAQTNEGDKAPDFDIVLSNKKSVSLSSYAKEGKAVLLHFWATWCPPCREELPYINSAEKRLRVSGSNLAVLCVCVNDKEENRDAFMEKYGYTFTGGLDQKGSIASLYEVVGIPTSVLIGEDGMVKRVHTGRMSERMLKSFIEEYE